ncbi:hypothetical protein CVS40_7303 [Lucilia cuprina]|nr:hypothetical protein CVS40_7303 [Lucilia cuprina]
MPTTSTTSTVDTTTSITATLAATTNISQDALNTSKTTAMSHSNQQQQQIPNTIFYLIGPIHNMSTGNAGAAAAGAVTAAGSGGTTTTTAAENAVLGPQGNATFIAVTHQQLQQHQQSTAHSTAGIVQQQRLVDNRFLLRALQQLPIWTIDNNNTSSNNNNNNPNDNNNNMDNTSEDSNPVTIYRCRAPIASLDCMEEFSGTGGHLDFGIKTIKITI